MVKRFWTDEGASVPVEYCLIAGLISIIIVTACGQIGVKISTKFYGPLLAGFN